MLFNVSFLVGLVSFVFVSGEVQSCEGPFLPDHNARSPIERAQIDANLFNLIVRYFATEYPEMIKEHTKRFRHDWGLFDPSNYFEMTSRDHGFTFIVISPKLKGPRDPFEGINLGEMIYFDAMGESARRVMPSRVGWADQLPIGEYYMRDGRHFFVRPEETTSIIKGYVAEGGSH